MSDEIAALRSGLTQISAELACVKAETGKARDYTQICNLQAAYGYFVDKGRRDDAADLFAADGTLGAEARWGEAACENQYLRKTAAHYRRARP